MSKHLLSRDDASSCSEGCGHPADTSMEGCPGCGRATCRSFECLEAHFVRCSVAGGEFPTAEAARAVFASLIKKQLGALYGDGKAKA